MTDNRYTAEGRSTSKIRAFFYDWAPVIAYCILIYVQSSFPSLGPTTDLPYTDKILHAGGYALLGFLFYRALRTLPKIRRPWLLVVLSTMLAGLYGATDEFHQYFVSSRSADIMDVAADFAGGFLGAWAARLVLRNPDIKS